MKIERRANADLDGEDAARVIGSKVVLLGATQTDKQDSGAAFIDPAYDVLIFLRRELAEGW